MEKILKYSTLIYALLLFIGYSYIDTYFKFFQINVFSFLDATEVLLSFLNNINLVVYSAVILSLSYGLPFVFGSRINLKPVDDFINTNDTRKKYFRYFHLLYAIASVIYALIQLIQMFVDDTVITSFVLIYIALGLIFFLLYRYLPDFLEKQKIKVKRQFTNIILWVVIIYSFNYVSATFEYKLILNKINPTEVSFDYDGRTIKTSGSVVYIGASSKYIFLRDLDTKANFIFEKDNIKNLTLHKKEKSKT